MKIRIYAGSIAALALSAVPAFAGNQPSPSPPATPAPCFDIVPANRSGAPDQVILMIDKCTGQSWYLSPTPGGPYQWVPVIPPQARR